MANQHTRKDLRQREPAREANFLDALRRIEQGTDGRCTTCGAATSFGRLLGMPAARTCTGYGRP